MLDTEGYKVMKVINDQEFQRHLAGYLDAALVEPVFVTKDAGTRLVVLSYEEYKDLRAKAGIQKAMHVSELSEADLKVIREAKMPPGYEHLNEEMED